MSRTIDALRALLNDGGPAAVGEAYAVIEAHDADPVRFACREFVAAAARHRHTLPSGKRRTLDRIAGNVRRLERIV